ncbi:MAG: TonB-dependent receptor [Methylobacter sp.]|uniref:TonB-dependent receptor n=1 Tax=Methylobacter sp. TaxID=2051955 RepID=UPI00258FE6CC|nr:TonB-dependent receptor [Methylobacter sp.]MCL7423421.1 TonB-dependent receptor [Methylobacter sp.]
MYKNSWLSWPLICISVAANAEEPGATINKNENSTAEFPVMEVTVTPPKSLSKAEKENIPVTTESVTKEQLTETHNLVNTEDAIKYLPSILVRKRYVGDTNAPVGSRTSGTSASARTLIYADGILLSSLLGNNNSNTGSPRWNMVSPTEIDRIDVMYGPFSAAYSGNSMGGVIDITTRMPDKFEASGSINSSWQDYSQYGHGDTYDSQQYNASLGDRMGNFSWRFDVSHLDSHSQPIAYATATRSTDSVTDQPVITGAVPNRDVRNNPRVVLGETNINHTVQDTFKWKLAYDFTPDIRASYTLGLWQNDANGRANTFLRDSAGNPVYSGSVNIDGQLYNIGAASLANNLVDQMHWSHGMSIRSDTGGLFDWDLNASLVTYGKDTLRSPLTAQNVVSGVATAPPDGAGQNTQLTDTGWHTVDARGIWRPDTAWGAHEVSLGYHHDLYELYNPVYNTSEWKSGANGSLRGNSEGKTETNAVWLQDVWDFNPEWRLTLGGRLENWNAYDGLNATVSGGNLVTIQQDNRSDLLFSPKAALRWQPNDRWQATAAIGQAYRFPTVTELYQITPAAVNIQTGLTESVINANAGLKPEEALSSELAATYFMDEGRLRLSLFHERVRDAIFSQPSTLYRKIDGTAINTVQNVDEINTFGIELAGEMQNVGITGLDISGSATWADSRITENDANPATIDKRQPRVPEWRATGTITYHPIEKLSTSVSGRYSSVQYGQLDNSDVNHATYFGLTDFFVVDLRARYELTKQVSIAAGIDNVNNDNYWIFHPFPQRTYFAELKYTY